ncbi:helix-turn-helix domain-containing protein [Maribacter sp. PR1]|uniref:Helix-turn-helix domain-containing protein n=1 Tax=Maribacter cobaltidurans TaxID=1178778 RepID=A0ABU7IQN8_9FLAO|nr:MULTISPECIES: helix-turn-helix domain-containing protein [Maribacter]MDC6387893.1 helix-turn-helix domain-containing protein [Maribacter sp. PR1]MEE1975282.1 helix-turn-helix domain-containing protein [Maribacter cobaltidurans]
MEEQQNVLTILKEIKHILGHQKKVMNVEDLVAYTGLSKSKIYKLTSLKLIPMSNNKHIRQIFFDKDAIDKWLVGNPNLCDEQLEQEFNKQLQRNRKDI